MVTQNIFVALIGTSRKQFLPEQSMEKRIANRLAYLREDVTRRHGSFIPGQNPFLRDVALWRAWKVGMSVVQVRAALLKELVTLAEIELYPRWSLAGEHLPLPGFGFQKEEVKSEAPVFLKKLGATGKMVREVELTVRNWLRGFPLYAVGESEPERMKGGGHWGKGEVFWALGWVENHSVRGYAKLLRVGYGGLKKEIENYLATADFTNSGFHQKENFWKAAITICEAGILLGQRYRRLAQEKGEQANSSAEKTRLRNIASVCRQVPEYGARNLREAVQSLWFGHILTCGEDGINANSLGRLDQIFEPYYQADLKAGRITRKEAICLMEELACKLYLDYDVQAIVLGGLKADGQDACNEMTGAILEATKRFGLVRDLSVRLHRQTPEKVLEQCAELVSRGGGIPFFFNDECFIPALVERGIKLEDARDYAPIGCIELTIPGKANPHAVSGWLCCTKCWEVALFNGHDPQSGKQLGIKTGWLTDHQTYESFLQAYFSQVEHFARLMVYHCGRGELRQRERGPLPCWSLLTDDCLRRGRDITDGGARYHYHSVCFVGTANTADSLMVLKKLVFQQKKISPEQLLEALRKNFQGYEDLRQLVLTAAAKYGNDQPEVDAIACQVANHFIDLMDSFRSPLGGRFFVHLFSFRCNLNFGRFLGATPDGRKAGEPLAYSLSAHQGRDIKGVTAMLNSLAKLPHHRAAGASAAIIDLEPGLVAGPAGKKRLVSLLQAAIALGVGQLQINVVTAERLKKAQAEPEKYGNIAVRVAGYSQMFKLLDWEMQEHIIARTKHRG
ncbi:MAG: hypothetical protein NC911_06545 [Candidatus Omnitrophica bacterium]|nr:hypothetical protein [Candidatus Omnitrophota bacterium]